MTSQGNTRARGEKWSQVSISEESHRNILANSLHTLTYSVEHRTLLAEQPNWEKEIKDLKGRVRKMEGGSTMSKQVRGKNNVKKENWEGSDYTSDDNINKCFQAKLYSCHKFLPTG